MIAARLSSNWLSPHPPILGNSRRRPLSRLSSAREKGHRSQRALDALLASSSCSRPCLRWTSLLLKQHYITMFGIATMDMTRPAAPSDACARLGMIHSSSVCRRWLGVLASHHYSLLPLLVLPLICLSVSSSRLSASAVKACMFTTRSRTPVMTVLVVAGASSRAMARHVKPLTRGRLASEP